MNKDNYEDIINLPHHTSSKHPRMNKESRAAQFAPFAALTGHSDAIKETERLTETKIELTEEEKLKLNEKLQIINENINNHPKVTITYFEHDKKKEGGKYLTHTGYVKQIAQIEQTIIFIDKTKVKITKLIDIII